MPRFFFDFCQGNEHMPDLMGVDFADVEQAYLEAFKAAQDMWAELLRQRSDPRKCRFEVRGDAGDVLFVLAFQEVLESCTTAPVSTLRRTFYGLSETHDYARRVRDQFAQEIENSRKMLQASHQLLRHIQP